MLAACCKFCCGLIGLVCVVIGILLIKPVNDALVVYSQGEMEVGKAFGGLQTMQFLAGIVSCMPKLAHGGQPVMVACGRQTIPRLFVPAHGWTGDGGVGIKAIEDPGLPGLWYYSHAAVNKVINDKDLTRKKDFFIASHTTDWMSQGYVAEGFFPLLTINRDTRDPVHKQFRDFLNDFFPALMKPVTLNLADATGSKEAAVAGLEEGSAKNMVASYLVKSLFDFWPDQETLDDISQWAFFAKPMAVNKGAPGGGAKANAAFLKFAAKVEASAMGQQFLTKAAQNGVTAKDPKSQLHEMLFITMFAGIGGTTDTLVGLQVAIKQNEKMVPIFWSNPRSFALEAARLFPAVAGLGGLQHEAKTVTLGNGRKHNVAKGDFFYTWNAGANVDPTVFGGPGKTDAYAQEFDPQRENLDKVMTYNGEIGNIVKCNTTSGCADTAARPCPGARLAIHTQVEVMKFFLKGMGKTQGAKTEL